MASTKKRLKVTSVVKNSFINAVHRCFIHVHLISIQDQNTEKLELAKGQMIYFLHSLGSLGFLDAGDFVSIRTKKTEYLCHRMEL